MPSWTEQEQEDFGLVMLGRWPTAVAGWGRSGLASFVAEVMSDGVPPDVAVRAVRSHSSDFPPSAPNVSRLAERIVQGNAPTFTEAQREIAARVAMLDYFRPASNFDEFVARLGQHHEITARYAVMLGPVGVRRMPDPRSAMTQSDSVRLSAHERDFGQAVKEWDADPTPGLALVEARAIAGVLPEGAGAAIAAARREIGGGS